MNNTEPTDKTFSEYLQKIQPALETITQATKQLLTTLATQTPKQESTAPEIIFKKLTYTTQKTPKLGEFETAKKSDNDPDLWNTAYKILEENNADINTRFHGPDYSHSYWLYADKIFRQTLKEA